jgi:hypothetical protein
MGFNSAFKVLTTLEVSRGSYVTYSMPENAILRQVFLTHHTLDIKNSRDKRLTYPVCTTGANERQVSDKTIGSGSAQS